MMIDASAMIAILDSRDPDHGRCMDVLRMKTAAMRTTEAALCEAMHIASRKSGWKGARRLIEMWEKGAIELCSIESSMIGRVRAIMEKYRDLPMDFGDATLVVLAEHLNDDEVFTLDSDFDVYRMNGRRRFRVVP